MNRARKGRRGPSVRKARKGSKAPSDLRDRKGSRAPPDRRGRKVNKAPPVFEVFRESREKRERKAIRANRAPSGLKGQKANRGEKGEKGEKGDQGEQGPQGPKGTGLGDATLPPWMDYQENPDGTSSLTTTFETSNAVTKPFLEEDVVVGTADEGAELLTGLGTIEKSSVVTTVTPTTVSLVARTVVTGFSVGDTATTGAIAFVSSVTCNADGTLAIEYKYLSPTTETIYAANSSGNVLSGLETQTKDFVSDITQTPTTALVKKRVPIGAYQSNAAKNPDAVEGLVPVDPYDPEGTI